MNSNKKVFYTVGTLLVLLIAVLLVVGRPVGSSPVKIAPSSVAGSLTVVGSPMHDFGLVSMARGKVVRTFTLKNNGAMPMTLTKMFTSCMCTEAALIRNGTMMGRFGMPGHGGAAPLMNQVLDAGDEVTVEVTFDPAAHGPAGIGMITRSVFIEQADQSPLELRISANVTP